MPMANTSMLVLGTSSTLIGQYCDVMLDVISLHSNRIMNSFVVCTTLTSVELFFLQKVYAMAVQLA